MSSLQVRDGSALFQLAGDVRTFLAEWEESDLLYSEAAEKLLLVVLRHKSINEAMREINHFRR